MTTIFLHARLMPVLEDSANPIINDGAVVCINGRIIYVGRSSDIPIELINKAGDVFDCNGRLITPALIDCHTHLVHGGNRAQEFEMRLAGASYEQIAREGGGIGSTVDATSNLSVDDLVAESLPRLDALLAEGISTVEIKSGYGLTVEAEIAMLRAARRLAALRPVRIRTSWLAAHALPAAYRERRAAYLSEVVCDGLARAHAEGLVDAVDGFCEGVAFSVAEMRTVFETARTLGLPVKLHAEQLSNLGGAQLAAAQRALSADHLEYLDEAGARALAHAGTVAVLLPGAFYTLRERQAPPVAALRAAGARIAVATDCNPGTSPLTSLLLAMNMAATLFGLTAAECLAGATREAARALGLLAETGTLEAGKAADLAIWDIEGPAELVYRIGFNPLHARVFAGRHATLSPAVLA